ncbi:IPT/TIG domain-containing protein [Candidatus Chloroploca sp. Khr17]|uniref:IPT/TIG domain-containing protein n=1 Tax=Candidatus Chloroploca sp. Khr17 TaxID=2496869 RepID=UPI00101B8DA6|nr:IPT/TIG domain-containing protein [Candidatus Chloroploca sp. Khr17]
MRDQRLRQIFSFVLLCILIIPAQASIRPVDAAPVAQGGSPVEFLEDRSEFTGLMTGVSRFVVGGGFLYWWKCPSTGPAATPTAETYLRRWNLRGGFPLTLTTAPPCSGETIPHAIADESGFYYWINDRIYRHSIADPFNAVTVTTAAQAGATAMTLDGDQLYWVANGDMFVVPRTAVWSDDPRYDDPVESIGRSGTDARNLTVSGPYLYWFSGGRVYELRKDCRYGDCTARDLGLDNGAHLVNATKIGPSLGQLTTPLWASPRSIGSVNTSPYAAGPNIKGESCVSNVLGTSCSISTLYTANIGANTVSGPMAVGGRYLFFIIGRQTCVQGTCYPDSGYSSYLMKYNLDQSVFGANPFDTPQPIACSDCLNGAYGITDTPPVFVANGWVYFVAVRTSTGLRTIARIRADAPAVSWDQEAQALEVVQSIQSPANDVPLVADKPTYVRFFGRVKTGPRLAAADAVLYGNTVGGAALPGSPLRPIDGNQALLPGNDGSNRADPEAGWVFELPTSWTKSGTILLSGVIDPGQRRFDPDANNNRTPARSFTFVRKAPICAVFIPVRTATPAAMFGPAHNLAIETARRILPAANIWVFAQNEDLAETEARFGVPPWKFGPYELPEDKDKILLSLWTRDQLSDDPDQCDEARARTHYVGVVAGDTPGDLNGSGRLGGDQLFFRLPSGDLSAGWRMRTAPTLAHELGHNYGRRHVDCPTGNPANAAGYPYPTCQLDFDNNADRHYAFINLSGTSRFEVVLPTQAGDLMSYAHNLEVPLPRWISDFTWNGLMNEIPNGAALRAPAPALAATGDTVLIGGTILPSNNTGTISSAWVIPEAAVSAEMRAKWRRDAAPIALAAEGYTLDLIDPDGTMLATHVVNPEPLADAEEGAQIFTLTFPAPTGTVARIELRAGETMLAVATIGAGAPTVAITAPTSGASLGDSLTMRWRASDPDGDPLRYTIQYSHDKGVTWRAIRVDQPDLAGDEETLVLNNISDLPGSDEALFRVIASDGYHTTLSAPVAVQTPQRAPAPLILAPTPGQSIPAGTLLALRGTASDAEDGILEGAALRWQLDGQDLGSGAERLVSAPAPGRHTLTLLARDSNGLETSTAISFNVAPLQIPQGNPPMLDGECDDVAYADAFHLSLATYADGGRGSALLLRSGGQLWACFAGLNRAESGNSGSFVGVRIDGNGDGGAPQTDDVEFQVFEDSSFFTHRGDGNGFAAAGPGGLEARVVVEDDYWSAELRIEATAIGDLERAVALIAAQGGVTAASDHYTWPEAATWDEPATWADTALGDPGRAIHVNPTFTSVGNSDLTLTITGEGFTTGATALFNGAPLSTTVVSASQLSAVVPTEQLTTAGIFMVTAANPGFEAAPGDGLPFEVHNLVPTLDSASLTGTTLAVHGRNFAPDAEVMFNGRTVPTSWINADTLRGTAPADELAAPDALVGVYNPGPGGGLSNLLAPATSVNRIYLPMLRR